MFACNICRKKLKEPTGLGGHMFSGHEGNRTKLAATQSPGSAEGQTGGHLTYLSNQLEEGSFLHIFEDPYKLRM
jgi:hypothetical protein